MAKFKVLYHPAPTTVDQDTSCGARFTDIPQDIGQKKFSLRGLNVYSH